MRPEAKEAARTELARRHFFDFAPCVYPAYQLTDHLWKLIKLLTAIFLGDVTRAIISMAPRHGKTLTTSKIFPAWYLGHYPKHSIMLISHTLSLARDNSRAVRAFVQSAAFQRIFPGVRLLLESHAVERWSLQGHDEPAVIAAGVGGAITGKGAHLIVADDLYKNYAQARSVVYNRGLRNWWKHTVYPRLEPGGKIILIGTRWTEDDFIAWLLSQAQEDPQADQWQEFNLPAINENGEALWPDRYPLSDLARIESVLGLKGFSAQYMCRPLPEEGGMMKRDWIRIVDEPPSFPNEIARIWDLAATGELLASDVPCYTAGAKLSTRYGIEPRDDICFLEHMLRALLNPDVVEDTIVATALADGRGVKVYIEQEPGSAGKLFIAGIRRRLPGFEVEGVPVSGMGSKETRATPLATAMRRGKFFLIRGEWNNDFIEEAKSFPEGTKDQIDAASLGYLLMHREEPGIVEVVKYA